MWKVRPEKLGSGERQSRKADKCQNCPQQLYSSDKENVNFICDGLPCTEYILCLQEGDTRTGQPVCPPPNHMQQQIVWGCMPVGVTLMGSRCGQSWVWVWLGLAMGGASHTCIHTPFYREERLSFPPHLLCKSLRNSTNAIFCSRFFGSQLFNL